VREGGEAPTEEREKTFLEIGECFFQIRARKKTKEKKIGAHGLRDNVASVM
jgi:hypothetical protein